MVICPYDPVMGVFKEQPYCCLKVMASSVLKSEAPLKEKPQCGLNMALDSEVTRSCDKIKNIIKLKATLWL